MRKMIPVFILLLLGALVTFQSSVLSHDEKSTQEKSSMKAMHEHCKKAVDTLDKVNTKIDQAHQQNDVSSLHDSLTEIQKSVKEAKEHINACVAMKEEVIRQHEH